MTKYIFVTGGVVSGLGKGITAASLGRLLKARGLKVAAQKLDPYINVDPGTMSPYQHGEVYVTEDGAETDLDLGHYERFIDEDLNQYSKSCKVSAARRLLRSRQLWSLPSASSTKRKPSARTFAAPIVFGVISAPFWAQPTTRKPTFF